MSIVKQFHEKIGHLVKGNVWNKDYAPLVIDEKLRTQAIKNPLKVRGSHRLINGLFYTDEERRKMSLIKIREK